MPLHYTDKIAVLAPTKWGKTTLARTLLPSFPRVIVLDVAHQFPQEEGDFVVESIPELGAILKLIEKHRQKSFKIIRRYPPIFGGDYPADLDSVIALAALVRNVMIVADEFQEFSRRENISPALRTLILRGRHHDYGELGLMGISQRPAEVSKTFLANCIHFFFGGFSEPNDLKFVSGYLSKTQVNSARALGVSQFTHLERPNKVKTLPPLFRV